MSDTLANIAAHFKGSFATEAGTIQQKLARIKAYVFDWDGVFNDGVKNESGSSPFNEVDSMGTNLLRFNHYLHTGELPVFVVISGEHNKAAQTLAKRECFHAVYSGIKNKTEAVEHLCAAYHVTSAEIAFMFDDVLDLSLAEKAGLRFQVGRQGNPLMNAYIEERRLADYVTANDGRNYAVREMAELVMGLRGKFNETLEHRIRFSQQYQAYITLRQQLQPLFYTSKDAKITEQNS